jgi:putative AlgH/UPF0301 family transcriptional regulator
MAKLHVSESKRTHKIVSNTQEKITTMNLENQLLIAMPSLDDSLFKKTVTYICEHNEEGAMGLIINLPIDITLCDLLKKIEPDSNDSQYESKEIDDENTIDLHHHKKKQVKLLEIPILPQMLLIVLNSLFYRVGQSLKIEVLCYTKHKKAGIVLWC